jgi:hypothetical protein
MGLRLAVDNSHRLERDEVHLRARRIMQALFFRIAADVDRLRADGFGDRSIREQLRNAVRDGMARTVRVGHDDGAA